MKKPTKNFGKMKKKSLLFVPFDKGDLSTESGTDYLNEIIWTLIEEVNELKRKLS